MFTNVLLNAAHAIAEGEPHQNEVRITTATREGRAFVLIADTGSGMTADVVERMFEPFFTMPICSLMPPPEG